ncbi:MAG: thioredoxin family protein [Bacteroidetes bacterium]|nr:thioredoxin family protein [Bacteroidota bacterium]
MKKIKFIYFVLLIAFFGFKGIINFSEPKIGSTVNDFTLKNTDNTLVSLNSFKNAKGFIIVFTCNHCPFAKLYPKRLNDLNSKYKALDIPLLAINSMDTMIYEEETFELMQKKVAAEKLNFPYLYDASQVVGKNFGAAHTPHAYIIWKENNSWVIKYSGAIDNNGEHPEKATNYIGSALDELLKNKPVSNPVTESFGCRIFYRK